MNIRFISVMALSALLTACASNDLLQPPEPTPPSPTPQASVADEELSDEIEFGAEGATTPVIEPDIRPGSGEFINREAASRRPVPVTADGEINLNFEAEPIQEVVHLILGEILQQNFVIGPGVGGEVTFATAKPVSREQLMPLLEMMLRENGATAVYVEDRYHILPIDTAVAGNLVPRLGSPENAQGFEVRAVPLEFIAPSQMAILLEPYARPGAVLNVDDARSLIVVGGTRQELRNYLQTIEIFDVDWLAGMSVGIIPVERVEVGTLVPELDAVFGADTESPLAGMFRFMPLERLNAVLVITPQPAYLDQAEDWIERLDRGGAEASSRLYVYRVENLEATVLAGYLSDLFGASGGSSRRTTGGEVAPGLEPVSLNNFNRLDDVRDQTLINPTPAATGDGGISLGNAEDVRITAVEETNSLLIQSSPQQYEAILAAIKRLDEEPLQVHVEAQVLEVVLNEQLEYGVDYFLANSRPGNEFFPQDALPGPFDRDGETVISQGADFIWSIGRNVGPSDFLNATVNLLNSVSDVRVLSAPSLLVRNNSEATINIGESISVNSVSFNPVNSSTGSFTNTQFLRTGITLSVTPRVNPGGLVYLTISQEVSTPSARPADGGNPDINNRSLNTEVAVNSGATVLLGGLIQERSSETESGIPGLRRIPLLGKLFENTTNDDSRTELLVLITPTVISTGDEMNRVTEEYQSKFRSVRPIQSGGDISLDAYKQN